MYRGAAQFNTKVPSSRSDCHNIQLVDLDGVGGVFSHRVDPDRRAGPICGSEEKLPREQRYPPFFCV